MTDRGVLKAVSRLWLYPDDDWRGGLGPVRRLVHVAASSGDGWASKLAAFLRWADETPEWKRLEHYVRMFDFGTKTTLYMTYRRFGEERERGGALLELKRIYEEAGFCPIDGELPDYLPMVLEFASAAPSGWAARALRLIRPELLRLVDALKEAGDEAYGPLAECAAAVAAGFVKRE